VTKPCDVRRDLFLTLRIHGFGLAEILVRVLGGSLQHVNFRDQTIYGGLVRSMQEHLFVCHTVLNGLVSGSGEKIGATPSANELGEFLLTDSFYSRLALFLDGLLLDLNRLGVIGDRLLHVPLEQVDLGAVLVALDEILCSDGAVGVGDSAGEVEFFGTGDGSVKVL